MNCAPRARGSHAGIIAGIEWAVDDAKERGLPAIISMSLGTNQVGVFDDAIRAAYDEGVLTIAAAGNSNDNACGYSPASVPLAVTVGSTTQSDSKSPFSSHGPCVDIQAPGSRITVVARSPALPPPCSPALPS